jgi:diguanylate cyclase (GGDEF)-like protein
VVTSTRGYVWVIAARLSRVEPGRAAIIEYSLCVQRESTHKLLRRNVTEIMEGRPGPLGPAALDAALNALLAEYPTAFVAAAITMPVSRASTGGRLVAEGVETEEEARTPTVLGVAFGQGYRSERPEPAPKAGAGARASGAVLGGGKALVVPEGAERREIGGPLAPPDRPDADRDRVFGRLLVICASATVLLMVAALATGPASERPGLLFSVGVILVLAALAAWFLKRGFSNLVLLIAGVVLMALGVMVGAALPDGLDAAVILPLTGALIASRVPRGRLLLAMFVAAFVASMAGEIAYHVEAWTAEGSYSAYLLITLASSAVMLAFAYGLAWWVTNEWQMSNGRIAARVRLFAALAEFGAVVNAIREPEQLVTALIDAVGAVVPSDTVVVTLLDRGDGRYRVRAVRGLSAQAVGAIIQPGEGTAGRAISERAVILTEPHPRAQSNAALRGYMHPESVRAVGVPLINEDTVLGVISVGRADTDAPFTLAEREVLALLGSQAALALANAYLAEEVSALAIHDGLTGLYNRRHFEAALDLAIARFKRRAPSGNHAAIMLDLDHVGDFNRQHGHLAGDALLRAFGEILRECLRSADIVARYGGEEFIAILEDCGLPEAVRLADEVRQGLEAQTVPGADGQPLRATVSAGCAVRDPADPTKEALIGRADASLFMAKEAGRNQVVAA